MNETKEMKHVPSGWEINCSRLGTSGKHEIIINKISKQGTRDRVKIENIF